MKKITIILTFLILTILLTCCNEQPKIEETSIDLELQQEIEDTTLELFDKLNDYYDKYQYSFILDIPSDTNLEEIDYSVKYRKLFDNFLFGLKKNDIKFEKNDSFLTYKDFNENYRQNGSISLIGASKDDETNKFITCFIHPDGEINIMFSNQKIYYKSVSKTDFYNEYTQKVDISSLISEDCFTKNVRMSFLEHGAPVYSRYELGDDGYDSAREYIKSILCQPGYELLKIETNISKDPLNYAFGPILYLYELDVDGNLVISYDYVFCFLENGTMIISDYPNKIYYISKPNFASFEIVNGYATNINY